MNLDASRVIRTAISAFLVVLIVVAWVGGHQPGSQALASRIVLTLCIVAGLVGLRALWRARPTKPEASRDRH